MINRDIVLLGDVRALCPMAPNNVNTMACAALAGHNLGFSQVRGILEADPSSVLLLHHESNKCIFHRLDAHIVEIRVFGPGDEGAQFNVQTVRHNPAKV